MNVEAPLKSIVLEPGKRSREVVEFEERLRSRIIGQDEAVSQLVNVCQTILAGMSGPGRPLANLLFLGPTGSGKTRLVEAAAEILFGSSTAFIKVDCAEFQQSHEISKLIGSPPGYIGHRETSPAITQEKLDQSHIHESHRQSGCVSDFVPGPVAANPESGIGGSAAQGSGHSTRAAFCF